MSQRRRMRLLFALGQVGLAHSLEGPTPRVLNTLHLVSEAWGEYLTSRQTVGGADSRPSNENIIAGSLVQARRFVEKM